MITSVAGFDFHCHVDLFPDPVAMIASRERDRIVTLAVTTTPKAWTQNRRWTSGSRYVYAAVGLHPELAGERSAEAALLEQLIADTPFVGEVGLDGSPPHRTTLPAQNDVFMRALTTAQRLGGRVLSIHSRRAARDVVDCLAKVTTPDRVLPILHWFSDTPAVAHAAAEWGCYFSINQRMLESQSGVALVRTLPSERLLTETDAPFTDSGTRKSGPSDVVGLAHRLATIRGVEVEDIRKTLAANAMHVFAAAGISVAFEVHPPGVDDFGPRSR